jgi:hypothetical protein
MVEGHVAKAVEVQVLSSALKSIRMLHLVGAFFLFFEILISVPQNLTRWNHLPQKI